MCLYGEDNATLRSLEQQLKDVQKAIRNVLKAIENGVFTRSTKEELETLETEEDEIKKHIEREKTARPLMTEKMLRSFLSRYTHFDLSVQRNRERIVDELVGSILLFGDGRLIITFNFRDNPHETTLDEIIAAANIGSTFDCLVSPIKNGVQSTPFFIAEFATNRTPQIPEGFAKELPKQVRDKDRRQGSDQVRVPAGIHFRTKIDELRQIAE